MTKAIIIAVIGLIVAYASHAEEVPASTSSEVTSQSQPQQQVVEQADAVKTDTTQPATGVVAEQSGFSEGSVMRSVFTNGIESREPIDNMKAVGNQDNRITYFSELRDMSGQRALHRWEHNGKVVAEVPFNVRGPRWRVWSSKELLPEWQGEWKVSVVNAAGNVISEEVINYKGIAEKQPETTEQPAASEPSATPEPSSVTQ